MNYQHYDDFDGEWLWDNFPIKELSCKCCGEYHHDPRALDMLQSAREARGKAFIINSAHRCVSHNRRVHGAKNSEHLRIAFDVSLVGHTKEQLLQALFDAGFTTFGLYSNFIHTDPRPWRQWYGCPQRLWMNIYNKIVKRG